MINNKITTKLNLYTLPIELVQLIFIWKQLIIHFILEVDSSGLINFFL